MNFPDLLNATKQGAVVVTVNQRLARRLSTEFEQAFLKDAAKAWLAPTVLSFEAWLLSSWQQRFDSGHPQAEALLNKTLLSAEQALQLWQQVINDSSAAVLLNVAATAKAANKARQLAMQWGIDPLLETELSLDITSFNQWQEAYQSLLLKNDWIDRPQLLGLVMQLYEQGIIQYPQQIVLAGFDVFTSQQNLLWKWLESHSCNIQHYQPYTLKAEVRVVAAGDMADESQLIAQWARHTLEKNPQLRIGIILPELQARRSELEASFMGSFYPNLRYPVDLPLLKPYNVSLGLPLSSYPPIQQILRVLAFFTQPLALDNFNKLLRSPFIAGGEAEWTLRGSLEREFRQRGFLSISIQQLYKALTKDDANEPNCPQLHSALTDVLALLTSKPNRAYASEWLEPIRRLLRAFNVQGDRELSSLEFQVFQAWDTLLHGFIELDEIRGKMNFESAIAALKRLAHERVFQPETPTSSIQIMGLMEAAGHTFDALWVAGLHDKCWPPVAHPDPFLPINQQRQQGLVQASVKYQHQLAKLQTEQWAHSAQQVIFSYPSAEANGSMAISPLLMGFPLVDESEVLSQRCGATLQQRVGGDSTLELLTDQEAPAVSPGAVSRGGVGILKDQAACPFKAFVHKRLMATDMEQPEPGLDARLRGSLVHKALENVWLKLKTQAVLIAMSHEEREELVAHIVQQVIEQQSRFTPILKTNFAELEVQRISTLLLDWLALDSERETFSVSDTELRQTLSVGPLQINTSIDRVDVLADGSRAIIDYKTGTASLGSWFGDRPEEPQLPLYGGFSDMNVQSISFAQLKKGECKYIGVSHSVGHFSALKNLEKVKGAEADWASQLSRWKSVNTRLAKSFMSGDARVDPTRKACEYCDLSSVCRINEHEVER